MFTGIVADVGKLHTRELRGPSARLAVHTRLGPLVLGESIAVDGACLTVDRWSAMAGGFVFEADCSAETLTRTTLGDRPLGGRVNLERALAVGERLGGHFVSGHIDGIAVLEAREQLGEALRLTFTAPPGLARYLVEKGSVALSGVSLTVNEVSAARFSVVLISYSQRGTTLTEARPGDRLNLEADLLAKYIEKLLEKRAPSGETSGDDQSLLTKLRGAGYL